MLRRKGNELLADSGIFVFAVQKCFQWDEDTKAIEIIKKAKILERQK